MWWESALRLERMPWPCPPPVGVVVENQDRQLDGVLRGPREKRPRVEVVGMGHWKPTALLAALMSRVVDRRRPLGPQLR